MQSRCCDALRETPAGRAASRQSRCQQRGRDWMFRAPVAEPDLHRCPCCPGPGCRARERAPAAGPGRATTSAPQRHPPPPACGPLELHDAGSGPPRCGGSRHHHPPGPLRANKEVILGARPLRKAIISAETYQRLYELCSAGVCLARLLTKPNTFSALELLRQAARQEALLPHFVASNHGLLAWFMPCRFYLKEALAQRRYKKSASAIFGFPP